MSEINSVVWAEYYRPKTIDECILPVATKQMVKDALASGNIPHFIFAGAAGTGKTSLARAIANEVDGDLLYLNCSLETSIDTIRSKVVTFSSSVSFSGNAKIVLLDEMEGMSQNAANSLKGVYEEFPNVRYIATTNHLGKVLDALKSRSVIVEFKVDAKEKPTLGASMFKRVCTILNERNVTFDKKVVAEIVNKFFPDFRRTLNEIQKAAAGGTIDSSILLSNKGSYKTLVATLKEKDFRAMRLWVGEHSDQDPSDLFRDMYDNLYEYFEPESIPTVVLLLADYQFKASHSVDQTINTAAFLVELMVNCKFK